VTRERHTTNVRMSARVDYGLRAAVELAFAEPGLLTAEWIAEAQQISLKFLEGILAQLRRAGIVRSQRGKEGGYRLARPAGEISLADVIRAIDGPLAYIRGERPEDVGYTGAAEALQRVWIALRANERAILESVTLADVASGQLPPTIEALASDPRAWVHPVTGGTGPVSSNRP
jgi:Rrf2 family protein